MRYTTPTDAWIEAEVEVLPEVRPYTAEVVIKRAWLCYSEVPGCAFEDTTVRFELRSDQVGSEEYEHIREKVLKHHNG